MKKVFVDTDVCLDVLSGRMPHFITAAKLFSLAEQGKLQLYVSSLCFANMDYILSNQYKHKTTRQALARFKTIVKVLAVNEQIIDLALTSDFSDFEDAIQYYTALEHRIQVLITRNTKDFKKARIHVIKPDSFLAAFSS